MTPEERAAKREKARLRRLERQQAKREAEREKARLRRLELRERGRRAFARKEPKGACFCDVQVRFCDKDQNAKDVFWKEDIFVLLTFTNTKNPQDWNKTTWNEMDTTQWESPLLKNVPREIIENITGFCQSSREHRALAMSCQHLRQVMKDFVYLHFTQGQWLAQSRDSEFGRGISVLVEGGERRPRSRDRAHGLSSREVRKRKREMLNVKVTALEPGQSHTYFQKLCIDPRSQDRCICCTPKKPGTYTARVIVPTGPNGEDNYILPGRFQFRIQKPDHSEA